MYRYSVNLSIAHYSRRNSIADAYVKPVFCDNLCANRLVSRNLFYIIYLHRSLSFFIFFAPRRASIALYLYLLLFASHRLTLKYSLLLSPSFLFILDLFLSFSHCIRAKKYRELSLTYFRNVDRTLSERNINEMLFKNVHQLIIVFIRSLL